MKDIGLAMVQIWERIVKEDMRARVQPGMESFMATVLGLRTLIE